MQRRELEYHLLFGGGGKAEHQAGGLYDGKHVAELRRQQQCAAGHDWQTAVLGLQRDPLIGGGKGYEQDPILQSTGQVFAACAMRMDDTLLR
ncbi:hypothetical protein [Agathobaculum desmolans]|uniref:hypothetical protein n=1 Tax=Agathobaculum desmolans TaxID=39484 RepID=UPI00248D84F9|nr:hypothetical protein [Agathobaculum desmolans]